MSATATPLLDYVRDRHARLERLWAIEDLLMASRITHLRDGRRPHPIIEKWLRRQLDLVGWRRAS